MYHSPFVQPPLTNVGSLFERLLGIFQDGGVIFRQPRSQGLSLTTWGGKSLGNKVELQALVIIQDDGHVKFPTLGICRMIKIPTLGTDLTVKAPWVASQEAEIRTRNARCENVQVRMCKIKLTRARLRFAFK